MRIIEAIIFDMDGTLIDSEVLWVEAIELALLDRGVPVTREEMSALVYGRSWSDIYVDIEARYPGAYASRFEIEAFTEPLFSRMSCERDICIHPSVALLRSLGERLPLAIVSGSTRHRIEKTIEDLGIGFLVDVFLGCEDVSAGKPDPVGFQMAARAMGVDACRCLVFEDSAAGVRAAKAAGMACVGLSRENARDQDLDGADVVLSSLDCFEAGAFGL